MESLLKPLRSRVFPSLVTEFPSYLFPSLHLSWFAVCAYCPRLSGSVLSDSATPLTTACQAPLSMGFSRQEHWSGLPCLPPGDLPVPGIKLTISCVSRISRSILYHWEAQCHVWLWCNCVSRGWFIQLDLGIQQSLPHYGGQACVSKLCFLFPTRMWVSCT